jgi:SAM-dependent methyltransferase
MANFLPLKNYIIYCIDRLVAKYKMSSPFLDAGCGIGDVSRHLAASGWRGKAIDSSPIAYENARKNLVAFNTMEVEKKSLLDATGAFSTILLLDALEHFENDIEVLRKIASLLIKGGYAVITVPSNPREWRWDDELYGHYHRYSPKDIKRKLIEAGLEPVELWDFTFPVFWILRKLYVVLLSSRLDQGKSKSKRTEESSAVSAWHIPFLSDFISHGSFLWGTILKLQFMLFRKYLEWGHEMIILAKKL